MLSICHEPRVTKVTDLRTWMTVGLKCQEDVERLNRTSNTTDQQTDHPMVGTPATDDHNTADISNTTDQQTDHPMVGTPATDDHNTADTVKGEKRQNYDDK